MIDSEPGAVEPGVTAASIADLQAAVAAGELTRVEIVQRHLDRIAAHNPAVGSVVELRADAVLAEAEEADRERGRTIAGRLDAAPVSVKESYGIAGLRRTDGLRSLAERRASRDDTVVARLREAGALLIGHGNVPDLCVRWNTVSGLYGATRNPRDVSRTVGGSSGGEAASVAAGFATAAIGQDLGGSIRVPAAFCGVFGMRTTPGVVPTRSEFPAFPLTPTTHAFGTIGPLARSVGDLEAVYEAIAVPDDADPVSVPRIPTSHREPGRPPMPRPAIAVLREEAGAVVDDEITARLDETCAWLREAGYEVAEHVLPSVARASDLWAELTGTDLIRVALPAFGDEMTPAGRRHVEELFGAFELGDDPARHNAAWIERAGLYEAWALAARRYPIVVAPIAGMPTPPLDFDVDLGRPATLALFDRMRCVPWVNLFGLPALALPTGIQLVGRRFHEADLLDAASAIEEHFPVAVATPA